MDYTEDDLNVRFKDIIKTILNKLNIKFVDNDIPKINNVEQLVDYFVEVITRAIQMGIY